MSRIKEDTKYDFQDVLIVPKRSEISSRSEVDLIRHFKTKHGTEFSGVPIIASNMSTGTFEMLESFIPYKMFVAIAKHYNQLWWKVEGKKNAQSYFDYGFYTIGMNDNELKELIKFYDCLYTDLKPYLKICVDIANGYTQRFSDFVKRVREKFPTNVLIAGNVATTEMTQELIIAGADFVKCGIGPGSACLTRSKTGVGYPQISASLENSDAAHGLGANIVLDGGVSCPGDVAKAFCANADMVMIGGLFAGTDECEGDLITKYVSDGTYERIRDGHYTPRIIEKRFKLWYGMSSAYANNKYFGGMKDYKTSEGGMEDIDYKGPVKNIIEDILGGLRSTCAYIGSNSIKNMGKCGSFVKVNCQKNSRFMKEIKDIKA